MSTRFKGFALLAILLCAVGVMPVFASPALQAYPNGVIPNSTNAGNTSGIIASPTSTVCNHRNN